MKKSTAADILRDDGGGAVEVERLGEVAVHTRLPACGNIIGERIGGDGENGDGPGICAVERVDGAVGVKPVKHGHHDVHEDDIEAARSGSGKAIYRLLPVFGGGDERTAFFEHIGRDLAVERVVLGHEDADAVEPRARLRLGGGRMVRCVDRQRQRNGEGRSLSFAADEGNFAAEQLDGLLYKTYPANWKDSYYFTFEGLGGYIANVDKITGKPLKDEAKAYVADKLAALQQELYKDFVTTDQLAKASDARALATENGKAMAEKAHKLGVELVEYITKTDALQGGAFTDVKAGDYYLSAVDWALDKAVTSGTSNTTFSPNAACTRAQAVTFLWRAAGSPEPTATTTAFTDVKEGSYYYKAVLWAVENSITSGATETTFAPDATCTRSQIVTFLYRMEKSPEATAENPFTDVKAGAFYENAVLWAVKENITTGATATTFDPAGDCTRGQIVTFLYRCLNK